MNKKSSNKSPNGGKNAAAPHGGASSSRGGRNAPDQWSGTPQSVWTQDDAIRDFFKRTKAMQEAFDPVVEANLRFSGGIFDCNALKAAGWIEEDDGVLTFLVDKERVGSPAFKNRRGKGSKGIAEEIAGSGGDGEGGEALVDDFMRAMGTVVGRCRFARPGNFLFHETKDESPKSRAGNSRSDKKTHAPDLRRLLEVEVFCTMITDEDTAARDAALERWCGDLDSAMAQSPLSLGRMLTLAQDKLDYQGSAELSSHDLPYGCLYNCILHFTDPGTDFRDGHPSDYRMASGLCSLMPLVRALTGREGNAARANVMAMQDVGLFCQLVKIASDSIFHSGAQTIAAAILLKCWDSLDAMLDASDFAVLAEALSRSGCHAISAMCYAKSMKDADKAYTDRNVPSFRLVRECDLRLKEHPEADALPELRYLAELLEKVDKGLAGMPTIVTLKLLLEAHIAGLEDRSLKPVARKALAAVVEIGEYMRPEDEADDGKFVAHPALKSQLAWDAWLAIDEGRVTEAIDAFPAPLGAYGMDISTVMPHQFVAGVSQRDIWTCLAAGEVDSDTVFNVYQALPAAGEVSFPAVPLARCDQTSLMFRLETGMAQECKLPRKTLAAPGDVAMRTIHQRVCKESSPDGAWPADEEEVEAGWGFSGAFPLPNPKRAANKANLRGAQAWQWYPWTGSEIAELRLSEAGMEQQLYVACPAYATIRDEFRRGIKCSMFVYGVPQQFGVIAESNLDAPGAAPMFTQNLPSTGLLRSAAKIIANVLDVKAERPSPGLAPMIAGEKGNGILLRVTLDTSESLGFNLPVFVNALKVDGDSPLEVGSRVIVATMLLADYRGMAQTLEEYENAFGDGLPCFPEDEHDDDDGDDDANDIHLLDCNLDDIPDDEEAKRCITSLAEGDELELRLATRTGPTTPKEGEPSIAVFVGDVRVGALPKPHDEILMNLMRAGKNIVASVTRISMNRGVVKIEAAISMRESED